MYPPQLNPCSTERLHVVANLMHKTHDGTQNKKEHKYTKYNFRCVANNVNRPCYMYVRLIVHFERQLNRTFLDTYPKNVEDADSNIAFCFSIIS